MQANKLVHRKKHALDNYRSKIIKIKMSIKSDPKLISSLLASVQTALGGMRKKNSTNRLQK